MLVIAWSCLSAGAMGSDLPTNRMSVMASESSPGATAGNVLDGAPETTWTTTGLMANPTLTINLGNTVFAVPPKAPLTISAIRVLPDHRNLQTIQNYRVLVSADSKNGMDGTWTLVAAGRWFYQPDATQAENEKRAWFPPVAATYLRLEAQGRGGFSAAEVRIEGAGADAAVLELPSPPAGVKTAPPPADAVERSARFAARDSAENLKWLATDFFAWIDLDHPDLASVKAAYAAGDHAQALAGYRAFFMARMRECVSLWPMMAAFEFTNPGGNLARPAELLQGIATLANDKVLIGKPGQVDWSYHPFLKFPDQFYPLLNAYLETGHPLYLSTWCDYEDDWAINWRDDRSAVDLGDNCECQAARTFCQLCRYFSWMAVRQPSDGAGKPLPTTSGAKTAALRADDQPTADALRTTTLARVLMLAAREYLPVSALYARSDPQLWQMDIAEQLVAAGILLERARFKIGDTYLQEGISALASFDTHCNNLDGTELQRDRHYNWMWLTNGALPCYRLLEAWRPDLLTSEYGGWFRDSFEARAGYLVRTFGPEGETPLVMRTDGPRKSGQIHPGARIPNLQSLTDELPMDRVPGVMQDATLQQILGVLSDNLAGKEPARWPMLTSDQFPYGGFYLIRQSWRPADQQATFYSAGRMTDGFRVRANNKFALHALGEDLIIGGEQGGYHQIPSPIQVDGREQQSDFGVIGFGHRRMYPRVSDHPSPFRWHSSERYDLVEGRYDGPFAASSWGTLDAVEASKSLIAGVSHRRQVHFLRQHGLWIIDDHLASRDQHTYTQVWELPVGIDAVSSDATRRTLATYVDLAAVRFHQFATDALAYAVNRSALEYTYNHKPLPTYSRAEVSFSGPGDHVIVTAIFPYALGAQALRDVQDLGGSKVSGFRAITPDGARARYLTAVDGAQDLTLDRVTARAESLLLVDEPDGSVSGIVLGCEAFSIHGDKQQIAAADFEFSIDNDRLEETKTIYRPVEPVMIRPETPVFVDAGEVTLTCATPGVSIHYTVDGTDPGPNSLLYAAPLPITAGKVVKAIAIRDGADPSSYLVPGTTASAITRAHYRKSPTMKAREVSDAEPGLRYDYYEAPWKELFARFDSLTAITSGVVPILFDISQRQTDMPFGFRYQGYLRVPADGVYTIHFPDEYCRLDLIAGYDIRLTIDGVLCLPEARRQAHGDCSISLAKGMHEITTDYLDVRGQDAKIHIGGDSFTVAFDRSGTVSGVARMNFPRINPDRNLIWNGIAPVLEISGPGVSRRPIPTDWLWHR